MKNILITSILLTILANAANCQQLFDLKAETYEYEGTYGKAEGMKYSLTEEISVIAKGSTDSLTLKSLELFNTSLLQAELDIKFEVCGYPDEYQEIPGDYFVTIAFLDENKNCLFSTSFVSIKSFSLAGVPYTYSNPPLVRESTGSDCFEFIGFAKIPVHHAFFYEEPHAAWGIKPVKYFSITAFHLGAG